MRVLFATPPNLPSISHLQQAIDESAIDPDEVLVSETPRGSVDAWIRDWAKNRGCTLRTFNSEEEALKILAKGSEASIVAVLSPDHPATLDLVARAESQRIPVFIYRELYRQDPRVNCRFSPVERPDVWLRALTAEQRDFFRKLHGLCRQYGVSLKTAADGGNVMEFSDKTQFEGVQLDADSCRVRPRGSIRYRRIRL